jgi:hypothetical protein
MPLLFWYLPFMIMSGAFDALYGQDETRSPERQTRRTQAGVPTSVN